MIYFAGRRNTKRRKYIIDDENIQSRYDKNENIYLDDKEPSYFVTSRHSNNHRDDHNRNHRRRKKTRKIRSSHIDRIGSRGKLTS